jgi:peptidoglycan/LPS O-acetylase OafA/YrhL
VHLTWKTTDTPLDRAFTLIANCGWMGVDLFFVLSGFLITGILIDARDSPVYFRSFYGRRALRILPLYYAFTVFFVVLLPLVHARTPALQYLLDHQGWLWAHATNIWAARDGLDTIPYGVGIAWSLALEEQFYLVWPFVVRWTSPRTLLRICIGCLVGAFALRLVIAGRWPTAAFTLMPARMDAFAMGAAVAIIARETGGRARLTRWAAPVGVVALGAVVTEYLIRGDMRTTDYNLGTIGYAAADWLALAVLLAALTYGARLLSGPTLRFFGRYSYAMYLFHFPLIFVLTPVTAWFASRPPIAGSRFGWMLLSFAASVGATVALSLLSWFCLEQPFLRLKRFFPYHPAPGSRVARPARV